MKKRHFSTLVRVSTNPKTLQQRPYLMVELKGLFQILNETRMPMTVTVFTQPIMNFLASVLRPRKKKKPQEEPKLTYTKIQKIYRLRIVRLKKEKSIAFLYISKSKLKRNENLKHHL